MMKQENKTNDYGRFDFVGKVGIFGGISAALVLGSLIYLSVKGITYGIDFSGGTEMQVKFAQAATIDTVRGIAEKQGLNNFAIQAIGDQSEFIIRFQTSQGGTEKEINEKQNAAVAKLRDSINTELASNQPEIRRVGQGQSKLLIVEMSLRVEDLIDHLGGDDFIFPAANREQGKTLGNLV